MTTLRKPKISLQESHPELAKQWHPIKNGNLTPFDVTAGSERKIWWQCPNREDHEWESTIYNRASGPKSGCPCCSGHKTAFKDSLAYCYPELAEQLHPTKNFVSANALKLNEMKS